MEFFGIQKTTLIDYPGRIAATLFTHGCNFRCPFCHNPELVTEMFSKDSKITEDDVLNFLKKRIGKLDGIVVTGGEPLLHKGLLKFLKKVKQLDFLVKVDTNGSIPKRIRALNKAKVVDYWAMDIKNSPEKYSQTSGVDVDLKKIRKSIRLIMESGVDYEFRTTFVPALHDDSSAVGIAKLVKGAKRFTVQNFRSGKTLDENFANHKGFKPEELKRFEEILQAR
ncbi:anaerobic ribonucleoside-triphosphate reductase activating protein [Candidatus Dojkabacteria bacterium]|nr:anaerobic ribonucleoside-triphosphate reductase activating protein [Candidatus Dojkabacteria bacterium]